MPKKDGASAGSIDAHTVGTAAGEVWTYLKQRGGHARLAAVKREVALSEPLLYMAMGWLAREGKLETRQDARVAYVMLKE